MELHELVEMEKFTIGGSGSLWKTVEVMEPSGRENRHVRLSPHVADPKLEPSFPLGIDENSSDKQRTKMEGILMQHDSK